MASPQKENGFTPIANEILEALAKINLSPYETRVLLIILRLSYGYKKKDFYATERELAEYTNISQPHIHRTLKKLCEKKIIRIEKGKNQYEKSKIIFEKDYEKWVTADTNSGISKKKLVIPKQVSVLIPKQVSADIPKQVSAKFGNSLSYNDLQQRKENNIKKTKKENRISGGEKNSPPTYSLKKSKKDPYLLSFFGKVYLRKTGIQYHCSFKKDTELMKKLLKQFPARLIRKLIILYIYTASNFDIEAGLTIGLFYSKFNALHLKYKEYREKFEKIRKHRLWEKERQKREEEEKKRQAEEFRRQWESMSMLEKKKYILRLEKLRVPIPDWMKQEVKI